VSPAVEMAGRDRHGSQSLAAVAAGHQRAALGSAERVRHRVDQEASLRGMTDYQERISASSRRRGVVSACTRAIKRNGCWCCWCCCCYWFVVAAVLVSSKTRHKVTRWIHMSWNPVQAVCCPAPRAGPRAPSRRDGSQRRCTAALAIIKTTHQFSHGHSMLLQSFKQPQASDTALLLLCAALCTTPLPRAIPDPCRMHICTSATTQFVSKSTQGTLMGTGAVRWELCLVRHATSTTS
jgi:hypothetical protein